MKSTEKYNHYFDNDSILSAEKKVKGEYIEIANSKLADSKVERANFSLKLDNINIIPSAQVKYEIKPYSLSYLITLQEKLEEKIQEFNIQAISVIQQRNIIVLTLEDMETEKYINDYLYSIGIDSAVIECKEASDKIISYASDCRNGSQVVKAGLLSTAAGKGTIGFHAKAYNTDNIYGIITCAHTNSVKDIFQMQTMIQ